MMGFAMPRSNVAGYSWSDERTLLVESLVSVFTELGYEPCEDDSLEDGYSKVALYALRGLWKHAARQLPDGRWTSKLGPDEDIEHNDLESLCGPLYGNIYTVMRKRRD